MCAGFRTGFGGDFPAHLTLVPAVGGKAQKLPLHRIDLGEICRDEVIAAALAGHHLKTTVHEGRGGPCAAEMDGCGEIPLLLRACRCVWRAGKMPRPCGPGTRPRARWHGSRL